jgi:hypothetical protein
MKRNANLVYKEMMLEVNKFINEMGLDCEILGLKTNQDKMLYYWNYIDQKNVFKGILELPNIYFIKLANLLCNTTERMIEFQEKFYNPDGNVANQLREYRRYLLDIRDDNAMSLYKVLKIVIDNRCWSNLDTVLMELYLEPIDKWICDEIIDLIHNENLTAEDIYLWYKRGKNVKSLISFDIDYIKLSNKQFVEEI